MFGAKYIEKKKQCECPTTENSSIKDRDECYEESIKQNYLLHQKLKRLYSALKMGRGLLDKDPDI